MEPSAGMVTGAIRFINGLWEYIKKRPNVRIELDYSKRQEISDEIIAVNDLPQIKTIIDSKVAVITLTNIGYLPVVISELGIVVNGEEIILTRVPPKFTPSYFNSDGTGIGGLSKKSSLINANIYQYAAPIELEQLDSHRQYKSEVKAALFGYGIDDIYVKSTIGKKWSIDKENLQKFYIEYDKDNPIPNPNRK